MMAAHRANLSIQQCIFKPQNKEMSRTDIHIRMVHLLTESKLIKLTYQKPLNFRGKIGREFYFLFGAFLAFCHCCLVEPLHNAAIANFCIGFGLSVDITQTLPVCHTVPYHRQTYETPIAFYSFQAR